MNHKIDIYLSVPYLHSDPKIREWRYQQTITAFLKLISLGVRSIYCPLIYSHCFGIGALSFALSRFEEFNLPFLKNSRFLAVLTLPGWDTSDEVKEDVSLAESLRIEVIKVIPNYDEDLNLNGFVFSDKNFLDRVKAA
ncbi:MAG: hypothetical protein QW835_00400 [Candidatus Hadarchaeum sp.]